MHPRLQRLIYVHDGTAGPLGAALDEAGRVLQFVPEGSGLFGLNPEGVAAGRAIAVRIDTRAVGDLAPELIPLVQGDVPCIVGIAGGEARVLVSSSALKRASPTASDLRGKVRYGLARAGWELE
ncbi:MAG: hypothetical protein QUU85_11610 [Candidatus Eisenbacteria bacterium]|nr:hypothetical protein [Candidatus Eisenbacteria bacterium]